LIYPLIIEGNQIGVLSAICPQQKKTFANVAIRSFLSGVFSCFLTACVAGEDEDIL